MGSIHVLVVDELTLVRAGIRALLEGISDVEVVAEAGSGFEGFEMARRHLPEVVLTGLSLPGMDGAELTSRITRELPGVRVIVVSSHTGEDHVSRALRSGAAGYVSKGSPPQELKQAIDAAIAGHTYVSPTITREAGDYTDLVRGDHDLLHKLTPRQQDVLRLIGEGRSTMQIAHDLGISHKTVETHRAQIMARLGVDDVTGMVRYAIRAGLVAADTR